MKKIFIIFFAFSISFLFSYSGKYSSNQNILRNSSSITFTFGNSAPTNIYDSYSSEGLAFKLAFERPVINKRNLRYNFGWQNISFGEHMTSYDEWSGLQVREGEKANLFDVGIKFIASDGISGRGFFRPYINSSFGLGFFRQYTEYDYPDTFENECDNFWSMLFHIIFDDDCDIETNYNINTVVDSRMSSTIMTVDLGTSFAFNNPAPYAIEIGVRYNIIKSIKASDWSNWEDIQSQQSFDQIIGKKLNADYKTIYLGFSWYFVPLTGKEKSNRKTVDIPLDI